MSRTEEVELTQSEKLVDGFEEMLPAFTSDEISEVFYTQSGDAEFC